MNPGNSGVSRTRAQICELLCMKLLKEFSTREQVRLNLKPSSIGDILLKSRLDR